MSEYLNILYGIKTIKNKDINKKIKNDFIKSINKKNKPLKIIVNNKKFKDVIQPIEEKYQGNNEKIRDNERIALIKINYQSGEYFGKAEGIDQGQKEIIKKMYEDDVNYLKDLILKKEKELENTDLTNRAKGYLKSSITKNNKLLNKIEYKIINKEVKIK